MKKLHTIIGAGGSIASNLVPELLKHQETVRLVSRSGIKLQGCESFKADALDKNSISEAIDGSSVVYLLIGIEYKWQIWEKNWPIIMSNVIAACKQHNASLIFFDNVYMYGKVNGKMTEQTPLNPCSRKGQIRASVLNILLKEMQQGNIKAQVARSADFYGPHSESMSFFHQMVINNVLKGKPAQWMINADLPHSLTYVPDAAKALYALSTDESAWGETWHLPTASPALTGRELVDLLGKIAEKRAKTTVLSKFMLKMVSIFIPAVKESMEMLYQNEFDYQFDSSKFEKHFAWKATDYETGLRDTLAYINNKGHNI
jgi:nucleoside-diphosphate-sugar epimerase